MGFFEFFAGLLAALYAGVRSYGLAIVLLTLVVRVVLLPLSIKQTRSMREMQRIQPELKKLQQKYKNNKQKLNEEMMKLYKEHGVNPFGGCLPLVMQFPVFIALYRVVRTPLSYLGYQLNSAGEFVSNGTGGIMNSLRDSALASDLHNHAFSVNNFLGILRLDCTPTEVLQHQASSTITDHVCGSGPISLIPYVILVVLMGATTYWQQRQLQGTRPVQGSGTAQQQQMQMMTRIMPVMLMVFSFTFPTGLTLYWLTSNVWTVFQQRKVLGPMIAAEGSPSPKAEPPERAATKNAAPKKTASKKKTAGKKTPSTKNAAGKGKKAQGKQGAKPTKAATKSTNSKTTSRTSQDQRKRK